ncbi:hypothetical protein NDU88_006320 [Pleurodeles waltl]|uniref:Secreted protein n=1 Tax=Pleurodeles waltl TaxID=8319 RepID=A0AAV7SPB8_PLEWA|nr:hypothetical protein NDU88_006320 [Pleurodeles waltl]
MAWACFCWRGGGGFVSASLSLTFGVAVLCGCLNFGGFRNVSYNTCGGLPPRRRCIGGLLHGVSCSSLAELPDPTMDAEEGCSLTGLHEMREFAREICLRSRKQGSAYLLLSFGEPGTLEEEC